MDCKEAIEQAINDYYGNNRLAAESAVKRILDKFSPERVAYVVANTMQQKDHDGRISRDCKEWAKGMDASPDHATQLIIDLSLIHIFQGITQEQGKGRAGTLAAFSE